MSNVKITVNQIRKTFIDYFKSKNHLHVSGASLLPVNDASLLFTTAGMVPFKPYFAGTEIPPSKRIVSIQKCIRTTDLESVGKTKRHLSFFEMLGNFSFGDYFKKEAIEFAWELSTQYLPFDKERIWVTIYEDDDEAFSLWKNHIGFPEKKIIRLGKKDNFWGPAGNTGACGPCSELYLDRGTEYMTSPDDVAPGSDGERFMEFWNLVFNQFNKNDSGEYVPLKQTGIDTGAGLERLSALLQGVDSVYDIDEFQSLRESISEVYDAPYEKENIIPIRVLCDHVRSLSFAMADGIYPSNESRGYVLRRMLRRAMLFGRKLGQNQPLLYKVVNEVENIYKEFYPELTNSLNLIQDYIKTEEERFISTLSSGSEKLEALLEKASSSENKTVDGKDVFLLYDTFGFPPEMTAEMAESKNLKVDLNGFQKAMEEQKERGKKAWRGNSQSLNIDNTLNTTFTGYEKELDEAKILAIYENSNLVSKIDSLKTNYQVAIVTDKTPFYAESGGQVADSGTIRTKNGWATVSDVQKLGKAYLHILSEVNGILETKEEAILEIDHAKRSLLRIHHSSTHLLNAALTHQLGSHIKQSGSLVNDNYLRFDFTHPKALDEEQLNQIEDEINSNIFKEIKVNTYELPIEEAKKKGAVMTFGEKYGDLVRIVDMDSASKEFCGGTHVQNTSEIKIFTIIKESSPGAGNRRIEAVAEKKAIEFVIQMQQKMKQIQQDILKNLVDQSEIIGDLNSLNEILNELISEPVNLSSIRRHKILMRQYEDLFVQYKKQSKKKSQSSEVQSESLNTLIEQSTVTEWNFQSTLVRNLEFNNLGIPELKNIADKLREENSDKIYFLLSSSIKDSKWNFVAAMSKNLSEKTSINLGNKIKSFFAQNKQFNGAGGGKAELAQASGQILNNFSEQIKLLQLEIKNILYQTE